MKSQSKNERASLETPFSHYVYGKFFRCSRAPNSVGSGPIWPKFELVHDFMPVIFTCKFEKDLIKNNREKVETLLPQYKSIGTFCCHGNQCWSNLSQNLMQPFPRHNDVSYKIWSRLANWPQRYSSFFWIMTEWRKAGMTEWRKDRANPV